MAQEIEQQHGVTMIPIPWEYADEMVYEGLEKAKSHGRSGGLENFDEIRSVVSTARQKIQQHPIYSKLNSEAVRQGAWRELSRRLLDEAELRCYLVLDDVARARS